MKIGGGEGKLSKEVSPPLSKPPPSSSKTFVNGADDGCGDAACRGLLKVSRQCILGFFVLITKIERVTVTSNGVLPTKTRRRTQKGSVSSASWMRNPFASAVMPGSGGRLAPQRVQGGALPAGGIFP